MGMSEWVALISPLANIVIVGMVIPALTRARDTDKALAVLQYQVQLLLQKNGINVPPSSLNKSN